MGKRARDPRTRTQSSRLRLWTRRLGHAYRRVCDSGWPLHVRTISASKKWSSRARNVRTTCVLGIRRSYIHQLAHASNPVPNTSSRRALSVRVLTHLLRPRGHFLKRVVHCIGDGTRVRRYERVNLRVVSALSSRGGGEREAYTDEGCVYAAHGQVPVPVAPSTAPATCIVRSSVDVRTCTSSGRGATLRTRTGAPCRDTWSRTVRIIPPPPHRAHEWLLRGRWRIMRNRDAA